MEKKHIALVLLFVFGGKLLPAQDTALQSPLRVIQVEEMVGIKTQFVQLTMNKNITLNGKTGLLSISGFSAGYDPGNLNSRSQSTSLVYHRFFRNIGVNSGLTFTPKTGFQNFIGWQYMLRNQATTILLLQEYSLKRNQGFFNTAIIEYRPAIKGDWSLYSRLQLHYNYDFASKHHNRSYLYARMGLSYRYLGFGLAANVDRYGAESTTYQNYGLFLNLNM